MKPIASILLALALHAAALSQAKANDGSFKPQQAPIQPRQTSNPDNSVPYKVNIKSSETLPFDVNQIGVIEVHYPQTEGFIPSIFEYGYIDTRKPNDRASTEAWDPLMSTETLPFDPSNLPSVADLREWLAKILKDNTDGDAIRLSDLFLNPAFFAAAHAAGTEADALRGELDWLMLSGVILGLDGDDGLDDFDGMDGSDDLRGSDDPDEIAAQTNPAENGFVFGTTSYLNEPINNGFVFGTTSYVNEPVTNGFIYGQSAYVKGQTTSNGFVFGEVVYLAGDSQDHNPDISND